jgi:hypothetical protein
MVSVYCNHMCLLLCVRALTILDKVNNLLNSSFCYFLSLGFKYPPKRRALKHIFFRARHQDTNQIYSEISVKLCDDCLTGCSEILHHSGLWNRCISSSGKSLLYWDPCQSCRGPRRPGVLTSFHIVTCKNIARQRLGKRIPAGANAPNNKTSIAR